MKNSGNQDNKLKIIEQLIILNDDDVFDQVENIINESLHRPKSEKITKQEMIRRVQQSNKDIEDKAVYQQDEVEKLTENW